MFRSGRVSIRLALGNPLLYHLHALFPDTIGGMRGNDMHGKGTHTLFGIGAAVLGIVLGIGIVYWDGAKDKQIVVQAATSACLGSAAEYNCSKCGEPIPGTNLKCKKNCPSCTGTANGHTCPGLGQWAGPGETCCKTIGSCDGEGLEGKPKEMPKEGGMPPMLPMLPMPMPKMPMPMPPEDPCKKDHASSSECRDTQQPSGISGFLGNLFGTDSSSASNGGVVQSTFQSATERLSAFLFGETESSAVVNTDANTNTVNNPTEAVVTPVVTGSNASQLTSSGGTQNNDS